MKTRIVVDSTADILPEYLDQIHTVPLTVSFGEEEYIDGVTIDHRTFYQKLIETDAMPSTSQVSPAAFAEQYDQAAAADEEVVVITISSKLSGTYQSAMIAAAGCSSVYVVDSENASVGCGILVGLALRYLRDGMTASAIAEKLQEDKKKIVVIAVLDTLEYLKRGGRISKAAAFAGGLLNTSSPLSPSLMVRSSFLARPAAPKWGIIFSPSKFKKSAGSTLQNQCSLVIPACLMFCCRSTLRTAVIFGVLSLMMFAM